MKQLEYPTLFCHQLLLITRKYRISLKTRRSKNKSCKSITSINFKVISAGDSYNDIGMLQQADSGILFCPPESVIKEFPQFLLLIIIKDFQALLISARQKLLDKVLMVKKI